MLKVGIAGYGIVGKRRHNFINLRSDLKTVAVCDITFGSKGFEGSGIDDGLKTFFNYKDLLNEDLDVLFVCLTNDVAAEVTMAGLRKGLHVFCEKPPGRNVQDIIDVRAVEAECTGQKLMFGFNHRYHDSIVEALKLVKNQELGKLINIRGVYGKSKIVPFAAGWRASREVAGGGILLDQGIHMVDLIRMFAGEFTEINSFISNDFWGHDVEDNAYALMKTKKGVVAFLHSTATQWRHRFSLELALEKGSITLTGILSGSKSYGAETITIAYKDDSSEGDPKEITTKYNEDNSWRDEIEAFSQAIKADQEIEQGSSMDALKTMELVYRIYCADKQWKEKYNLKSCDD